MMAGESVLFYVQHLLGVGHLRRAVTLAQAMHREGLRVTVVSGGEDVPVVEAGDVEFLQLPSVRAVDKYFKVLVDEHGNVVDDAWKGRRRDLLLAAFERLRPRVVMVELFPFGRRQMRFELTPLLEAARAASPRPHIVSSVRDILVEKEKPERNIEMVERAKTFFDTVLVHSDPGLISFGATFPLAREIEDRIVYTGYVVDRSRIAARRIPEEDGEVLVSAGGGAVSEALLETALAVRPRTDLANTRWRFLIGHNLPEERFREFRAKAPDGVVVERARADFVGLLANCRLSISQGGYNTVMEVLATGARGVIVPYAGGEESEQTLRAGLLAERGLIHVVPENRLEEATLADAIAAALSSSPRPRPDLDMAGAEETARRIAEFARQSG
jgi:predicted glycosyltransferase